MRPIFHPLFVYQPWSEDRRERASNASLERLGIAPGHRRVCGVDLPEEVADRLAPVLYRIAQYPGSYELGREAALQFLERGVWALRPYMRDTPQWVRARIMRRRKRLLMQRRAEAIAQGRIIRTLTRMEETEKRRREAELMAEEDKLEHERTTQI